MIGSCVINGVDIAAYGIFILRDGDNDLLPFPERKPPLSNNWYEQNGIDADLSEIYFKEKRVDIRFHIMAATGTQLVANWARFRSLVTAPGYHRVYIREFDQTFPLRYVSCPEYEHRGGLWKAGKKSGDFTVTFSLDDPLQCFQSPDRLVPITEYPNRSYVMPGDRDLGEYGIIVTECYGTMLQAPDIKKPLIRSFGNKSGLAVSVPSIARYEVKQVIVACTMRATSLNVFKHNYEALFNNLTAKGELSLSSFAGDERCFYSTMRSWRKHKPFKNGIKVSFELVFTCIDSGEVVFLLASEDGRLFETEDGNNYIDMTYYG